MIKYLLSIIVYISIFPLTIYGKINDNYELTVKVSIEATKGWNLYQKGVFIGKFNGGNYTNPDESTQVHDFWSDGYYAKYDRDNNGHHETIFIIREKELIYVGSIGSKGTFVDVSNNYRTLLHKSISNLLMPIKNH